MARKKVPAAPTKTRRKAPAPAAAVKRTRAPKTSPLDFFVKLKLADVVYETRGADCRAALNGLVTTVPASVQFSPVLNGVLTITRNGHSFERYLRPFAIRQFFIHSLNREIFADLVQTLGL